MVVEVDGNETIEGVKERIEEKTGISVGQLQLVYGGRYLRDSSTLSDYGIRNGQSLSIDTPLRGG
uniref:Ubiquitin-like domain-containing protein n=1 Tax=Arcella intermedia TaxID=1963864 RepID=A0A6B2LZ59_9EUKA